MFILKRWWKKINDFFFLRKMKPIERKLETAYIERIHKRRDLKKEIEAHVSLKLQGREKSKYIPPKLRREILHTVYQQFGPRMREVDLYLKPNLEYNV